MAIEFCNVKAIEKYKTMLGAVDKSIQISLKDETVVRRRGREEMGGGDQEGDERADELMRKES